MAEERLLAPALRRIDPREYWRVTLLGAFAAFRRGEDRPAGALAARAFEEAARLGQPQLPLIRERAITEQLLGLAVETGQPAAAALRASALPVGVDRARPLRAHRGRAARARFAPGQEAQLLKFVAVSGGQLHAEQAIETLWPEGGRDEGRNRLRTVLNRLRAAAGNVLVREGDMLVLDRTVSVDFEELFAEARRAEALATTDLALAAAIARGAIVRYRGELLPEDRYEDWAERPRQRARRAMLDLLDLCASEAARRGDLDGLRRMVERTIEFAPYDDLRYLRAATDAAGAGPPGRGAFGSAPGALGLRRDRPRTADAPARPRALDRGLSLKMTRGRWFSLRSRRHVAISSRSFRHVACRGDQLNADVPMSHRRQIQRRRPSGSCACGRNCATRRRPLAC